MCKVFLPTILGSTIAPFIGAASITAATRETSWYFWLLFIGGAIVGGLFVLVFLWRVIGLALRDLWAIHFQNDWRWTCWSSEQRMKVTLWFADKLRASKYRADCIVEVGTQTICLSDRVNLGGTYVGQNGLISGLSGPVMAEFLKGNLVIKEPESATICVSIQPRDSWGAAKKESRTIPIQVISR